MLFSKSAQDKIHQLAENPGTNDEANRAAHLLQNAMNVINQVDMQDSREDHYYYYYGRYQHIVCAFSSKDRR